MSEVGFDKHDFFFAWFPSLCSRFVIDSTQDGPNLTRGIITHQHNLREIMDIILHFQFGVTFTHAIPKIPALSSSTQGTYEEKFDCHIRTSKLYPTDIHTFKLIAVLTY